MPPCSFGFEQQIYDRNWIVSCPEGALYTYLAFFFLIDWATSVSLRDRLIVFWLSKDLVPAPVLEDLLQKTWFAGRGFIEHEKTVSCKSCSLELKL